MAKEVQGLHQVTASIGEAVEATHDVSLRFLASHYIRNYQDDGIVKPVDTAGQNDGTNHVPSWIYRASLTYDLDPNNGAASEADYAAIGAQVYGMATDSPCLLPGETFSIAAIFRDIRTLGTIFDVSAKAEALIAQIQSQLDEVQAKVAGLPPVPAIYYEDGQGPFTIYGEGLATEFMTLAGGQNLLADQPAYTQVSAEGLAALPAEVWIITDYPGMAPVAERAEFLYATFPNMPAAQNRRSVGINGAEAGIGIRFPTAIAAMAKALHPEAFQ